jgi:predicted Zn-dependent protease
LAGRSLLPLLAGKDEEDGRELYFESLYGSEQYHWAPLTGIIAGGFKYISLPKAELYDLRTDKAEKSNLFLQNNRLARDLDAKLTKLLAATSRNPDKRDARQKLSAVDTRHLQALGYISSFSVSGPSNLDPKQGIQLENRAKIILKLIEQKDSRAAEKALHDLGREKPEILQMPFYFDFRHRIYLLQNKVKEALAVIKQAVETFPQDEAFFIGYAIELSALGLNEKAEAACRQILERNPLFTRAHILLAEIAEKRQDINQALMHYEKALMLEPENISLRLKQAELLIQKGEYSKALACYNILLKRPEISKNPGLLFKIALFNSQSGDLNLAERLMADAVSLESRGSNFYYYALILAKNGKIDAAAANMEIALNRYRSELNKEQLNVANKVITAWKQER